MRLQLHRKLERHTGCVNTVGFNDAGDTLISGSDDQMVVLWDWATGAIKLEFHSGHGSNVFQARFMPGTDDRTIVTCGADGEVGMLASALKSHVQIYLISLFVSSVTIFVPLSGETCQDTGWWRCVHYVAW
jgi:WD40 repeat protein